MTRVSWNARSSRGCYTGGLKVTGASVIRRGRWDPYRGYVGRWELEQQARERRLARLRNNPPAETTNGGRARNTIHLAQCAGSFRLVDKHGRDHGQRYERLGPRKCYDNSYRTDYLVADGRGVTSWMDGSTRVRAVTRHTEDLHSQASRIINRLHRELTKGAE